VAEFHFYGSGEDRQEILACLFELGFRAIPNLTYEHPQAREFARADGDLHQTIEINRILFLAGPYSKRSPYFVRLPSGRYEGRYQIDINRGGPLISLALPGSVHEGGLVKLTPGSLFHPRLYWDDDNALSTRPPELLRDYYGRLRKAISKIAVPQKPLGIRITKNALGRYEMGSAEILVDGKWLSKGRQPAKRT